MAASQSAPAGPALLFCPGDRPDRFGKALAAADSVLIDLEDAVSPERKELARRTVREALESLPPERTVVRINSPRTEYGQADLEMLRETQARFVIVPKTEDGAEIRVAAPLSVVALCETARGVQRAPELAATEGCVALLWGGEDLTADIGGWRSRGPDGRYLPLVQYARSRVLIAAASARIPAWDGVYLALDDLEGLERECYEAVSMGFAAKAALHPTQAKVIRDAYRPSAEQVEWATRLLEAVRAAESGVTSFDGRMVDGPLITMAQAIVDTGRPRDDEAVRTRTGGD